MGDHSDPGVHSGCGCVSTAASGRRERRRMPPRWTKMIDHMWFTGCIHRHQWSAQNPFRQASIDVPGKQWQIERVAFQTCERR